MRRSLDQWQWSNQGSPSQTKHWGRWRSRSRGGRRPPPPPPPRRLWWPAGAFRSDSGINFKTLLGAPAPRRVNRGRVLVVTWLRVGEARSRAHSRAPGRPAGDHQLRASAQLCILNRLEGLSCFCSPLSLMKENDKKKKKVVMVWSASDALV